jgi:hypothetical protein
MSVAALRGPRFVEAYPAHSSAEFRAYVQTGLRALLTNGTPIALATYRAITRGRTPVDELGDLTQSQYDRARAWMPSLPALRVETPEGRRRAARLMRAEIDGMADWRKIYVMRGLSPTRLARLLVHEVNHALNPRQSMRLGPRDVLVAEYRSLYAEAMFDRAPLGPAECRRMKMRVIADYGLRGKVAPNDVPDVPPGLLLP